MKASLGASWQHLRRQPLHRQLRLLRWNAPMLVLALATLHQLFVQTIIRPLNSSVGWWLEVLVYTVTGSVMAWWGLTYIAKNADRQAETERELRRAFDELEDNHQKLLALDRYGQYIAAAPNEDEVYKVAVQAPTHLAEAQSATIVTFDEEKQTLNLAMAWGLSETYAQSLRNHLDYDVSADRCRTCSVLHAHVDGDCPLFVGVAEQARADGIHSLVCVPINTDQERVGVLTAYFPSADGPKEEQAHLLNILGGVIAFAVDSLRSRERQMEALHSLDDVSRSQHSLDALASQTLQVAMRGWKAQAGAIFLYQSEEDRWLSLAQEGLEGVASARFALAQTMAQEAFSQQSLILHPSLDDQERHALGSAAALPLITEGQSFGALFLGAKRQHGFSRQHADLLQTIAHQISLAIRNAQLYAELQQTAMLRERYRLAREFHDGLAQTLGYLGLQLDRLERMFQKGQYDKIEREINETRQIVRSAYMDVREAIEGLRLRWDDPEQLARNLGTYVHDFARQTELAVTFTATPEGLTAPSRISLQLLRIAQEALTNVRKHARAQRVDVHLVWQGDELELRVADDGVGFSDEPRQNASYRSYGLTSMRERAESIGGRLSVVTGPGQGSVITVTVPMASSSIPAPVGAPASDVISVTS
jgi:signal transduction histidine kinase